MFNLNRTGSVWDRSQRINTNDNWDKIESVIKDRGVEILSDAAFLDWLDENGINHREEVQSFADLPSNDSLNTVRGVSDSNKIYIKKENGWVPFQTIDISKINLVEEKVEDLFINIRNFGAIGDGETNDLDAILTAKAVATDLNATLYAPSGDFKVVGDLDLTGVRFINFVGSITFENPNDKLIIAHDSRRANTKNYHIGDVFVGQVELKGLKNTQFSIAYTRLMTLWADSSQSEISSIAYNSFYPGRIDTLILDGANGGWINENKFFGGRLIEVNMDGDYGHNHNIFYAPTLERTGKNPKINLVRGNSNEFLNIRWEGGAGEVYCGPSTWDNIIERSWTGAPGGYQVQDYGITHVDEGTGNIITNGLDKYHDIKTLFTINKNTPNINTNFIDFNDNKFSVNSDGIYEKVYKIEKFIFEDDISITINSDETLWRARIYLHDSLGDIITPSELPEDIIRSYHQVPGTQSFYTAIGRSEINFLLKKHPSVKYGTIEIHPISTGEFSFLHVEIIQRFRSKTNLVSNLIYNQLRGSKPPNGNLEIGTVCWSTRSANNSEVGWKMTETGWKAFGQLGIKLKSNDGTFTADGTGTKTFWTIPHGLGEDPTRYGVIPANEETGSFRVKYVNSTITNLVVFLSGAVPEGVENVKLDWWVEA